MTETVLAIDIGGTKIAVALVTADGDEVAATTAPTVASPNPDTVFAPAADAIAMILTAYPPTARRLRVGIGSAGPINAPAGTISPVNIAGWKDFPIAARLTNLLESRLGIASTVGLAGDGHCFALGEHWLGAARDLDTMVGVVLSTGVGGGAVLNNRLFAGSTGNAVHLGHISVNAWGPRCVCGSHGCTEMYARGPALVAAAKAQGWSGGDTTQALAADARAGNTIAVEVIDHGMRALAAGIAATAAQLDAKVFVLGGGVAKAGDVIFTPLRRHLSDFAALDYVADLQVRPAVLSNAGLIGAAALALTLPDHG